LGFKVKKPENMNSNQINGLYRQGTYKL